jgi:hypothetical protein
MHISGQSGLCKRRILAYLPFQETITPSPAERIVAPFPPGMLSWLLEVEMPISCVCGTILALENVYAYWLCSDRANTPRTKNTSKHEKEDLVTRKGKILDGC